MIEKASAASPEKTIDIAIPPPRQSAPLSVWIQPGRACSIATSRSASLGRTRPARRAAATTASCAMAMPPPRAAASGIQEWPGSKPCGATPWSASTPTIADASGRPAARPSADADDRQDQRLGGDQPAHLARRRARGRAAPRSHAGAGRWRGRRCRPPRTARWRRRCHPSHRRWRSGLRGRWPAGRRRRRRRRGRCRARRRRAPSPAAGGRAARRATCRARPRRRSR